MNSTILITGGAGYIGSHTAFYMAQKGYKVIVIDDLIYNQKFDYTWAQFVKTDFANQQVLDEIFKHNKIDAVMHFAGSIEVSESIKNPIKYYINNVANSLNLLNTMLNHGVNKFIFSSTCAIYGDPIILPLSEDHPTNPLSVYGQTKQIMEDALKTFNEAHGLQYVSLRYFNAAGALPEIGLGEQHEPETHLIPLLLQAANTNKPFNIFGTDYQTKDGTAVRDFIHVVDIAEAHYLALKHLEENNPSDVFNLGTGQGFSIKELISAVENLFRVKLQIVFAPRRMGDPAVLVSDPRKANMILKWKPKYSDIEFILRSASVFESNLEAANKLKKLIV